MSSIQSMIRRVGHVLIFGSFVPRMAHLGPIPVLVCALVLD